MKSTALEHWGFLTLLGIYFAFSLFGLDAIPRPFGDEAWYAIPTLQLVEQGVPSIPILPGRGDISVAYLQPKLTLNLLSWLPVAVFGPELAVFRSVSVCVNMLAVLCLYIFTLRLCGKKSALIACIAYVLCFWTVVSGRCFRPEVFEASFALAALTCASEGRLRNSAVVTTLASLFSVLALLSHQVMWLFLPVALGIVVRPYMDSSLRGRVLGVGDLAFFKRYSFWFIAFVAPYCFYILTSGLNLPDAFLEQLNGEGDSFNWSLALVAQKELGRVVNFFALPRGLFFLLACLVGFVLMRGDSRTVPVTRIIMVGVLVLSVVPLATGRYLFFLVPYFSIGIAQLVGPRGMGYAGKALFALYVCSMLAADLQIYSSYKAASYADIVAQLKEVIPEGAVVAGPIVFALGLYAEDYQVTNVPPSFESRNLSPRAWLTPRLQRSEYILEVTSGLQSTGRTGPRGERFRTSEHLKALGEFVDQEAVLISTIGSTDYGPIRIWKRENESSDGAGKK
jgi:4-amino-4-deoxy-L-arabinose transferase-like glycosyltransferase